MTVGVFTGEDSLLDTALQWCAAAGVQPFVGPDWSAALRHWRDMPIVIIGADVAPALAAHLPPRRAGVIVVFDSDPPWQAAVALGAEEVLGVDDAPNQVIALLQRSVDGGNDACVLGVLGACGGAGASSFAAALAYFSAQRGMQTMLIDADRFGGGVDLVLGAEHVPGMRWPDVNVTQGHFTGVSLRASLPESHRVSFLSWGRERAEPHEDDTNRAILSAARRSSDLVVIDLDRSFSSAEFVSACLLTVVLVPEEVRALAAASLVLSQVSDHTPCAVVTRQRNGGVDAHTVQSLLGFPVLARIKNEKSLPLEVDYGRGPWKSATMRAAATQVLDSLGLNP